jgi:CO/xanthine dehydrogenase Mo-binding subunit
LIDVDYEILTTISDPEEALATPEPRIHEYGEEGNIHKLVALEFGNVEQGFAEADEIFEDTFFYQGNTHLPIEQHASVAIKDPDGKLTIWSSADAALFASRPG